MTRLFVGEVLVTTMSGLKISTRNKIVYCKPKQHLAFELNFAGSHERIPTSCLLEDLLRPAPFRQSSNRRPTVGIDKAVSILIST